MKKICINPKNYKLTLSNEYEVLKEEDGFIFIINDSGKTVRYDSSLFQTITQEVAPPQPPPKLTESEQIQTIKISNEVLSYDDEDGNVRQTSICIFSEAEDSYLACSCGISSMFNICNQIELIEEVVGSEEDDLISLKQELFRAALKYALENKVSPNRGMQIASINNGEDYEDYETVLNEESTGSSDWFYNPNSGNNIKMWYFIVNQ